MVPEAALKKFQQELQGFECKLIAVSKTYPPEKIQDAYDCGQRAFGENKVQEMVSKAEVLPEDIEWHLIGHLQSNKVKYIAPFVHLIHSVDSVKLLQEVNKQASKNQRIIPCLLQIHIAEEETKFGLSFQEAREILNSSLLEELQHVRITGFMGMATNTSDHEQVRKEFRQLKNFYQECKALHPKVNVQLSELSMGMSGDYRIALEEGSTMIRIGSAIFGARDYDKV